MGIQKATSGKFKEWALSSYLENLQLEKFEAINITNFHKSLTDFIKTTENPEKYFDLLEELALAFEKALKKVDRRLIAYRDDFLSTACRLYSLLDNKSKVKNMIEEVENDRIENIHKEYVLQKMYKYFREGENFCNVNKRWRKALQEYRRTGKGKQLQKALSSYSHSGKVEKKGFFQKLLSAFGL